MPFINNIDIDRSCVSQLSKMIFLQHFMYTYDTVLYDANWSDMSMNDFSALYTTVEGFFRNGDELTSS